ncbi:DUF6986 family protein [uncultured Corynebacterium sp.]|uniref:DUF6986 family protein n=1 Tax=uncultured Corynebacterium sp. TaxID=159447 RepID=UPI0025ED2224|nr:aldolase [uncultured Corynebacterium sp.]
MTGRDEATAATTATAATAGIAGIGATVAKLRDAADAALAADDAHRDATWPGPVTWRQPVHTVYVPADRFHAGLVDEWGATARETWARHGGGVTGVADLLAIEPDLAREVVDLVDAKLATEPIEDLRIDFEDGFTQAGVAPGDRDADEDARVDDAVAAIADRGAPAAFWGIRFGSFDAATRDRGIATLVRFLTGIRAAGVRPAPRELRLTFPKVTSVTQVEALVKMLEALESDTRLGFEIQVETPQSIIGADGTSPLPAMITAGGGRVLSLHYGTYDYSAYLGVAAADQAMDHPVADHAKDVMQAAAAGRGVEISDGSTNRLPVGARDGIRVGWTVHGHLVRRHLARGIWQGWDLHPNQLPTRFAATYAYFRVRTPEALDRLDAHLSGRHGAFADEPATAKALASFLGRAVDCGAVTGAELRRSTGLDRAELAHITRYGETP